jgi:hypothetical protein
MRALHELLNHAESALPLITAWARDAELPVELLPPSAACDAVLLALQVTTRSPLGPWPMAPAACWSMGLAAPAGFGPSPAVARSGGMEPVARRWLSVGGR